MKMCSSSELCEKEVINLCDGMRLGFITDLELDLCNARVISVMIPSETGFFGFPKGECLVIPWEKIECIGEDTILVKVNRDELLCRGKDRKKKKKPF